MVVLKEYLSVIIEEHKEFERMEDIIDINEDTIFEISEEKLIFQKFNYHNDKILIN